MRIYKAKNYDDMSRKAANIISAQVIIKPSCVLGLATGSSPLGVYRQLTEWYQKGDIDFSEIKTVNLDEYVGMKADDPHSYRYFMNENFFSKVNVNIRNTNIPDGTNSDSNEECGRYEQLIERFGGIDTQLLGLGHNGHIGFNEPGAAFEKYTHKAALTESTVDANRRFFEREEDMPKFAYTMGIKSIMHARHILVIVSGKDKAEIVKKAFFGEITPNVPASVLQLHNNVTLVGDEDALSLVQIYGN